jgi:putative membrane protein
MRDLVFGFHFVAFGGALSCLGVQLFCLTRTESMGALRVGWLSRIDAVYGLSALFTLVTGLSQTLVFGKGSAFYIEHPIFWIKVGLFGIIGILSIAPTLQFLSNRELTLRDWSMNRPEVIRRLIWMIRLEILLYAILPFLASILARGGPLLI